MCFVCVVGVLKLRTRYIPNLAHLRIIWPINKLLGMKITHLAKKNEKYLILYARFVGKNDFSGA